MTIDKNTDRRFAFTRRRPREIMVCQDCLVAIEGDGMPENEKTAARVARGIAQWIEDGTTLHGGDKSEEFSRSDCDCCGTGLAGSRHEVVALEPCTEAEYQEFHLWREVEGLREKVGEMEEAAGAVADLPEEWRNPDDLTDKVHQAITEGDLLRRLLRDLRDLDLLDKLPYDITSDIKAARL